MEKKSLSRKELKKMISEAMQQSIGALPLPSPTKKLKKLITKQSKKIAISFAEIIKREEKKVKKTQKTLSKVEGKLKDKKVKKKPAKV